MSYKFSKLGGGNSPVYVNTDGEYCLKVGDTEVTETQLDSLLKLIAPRFTLEIDDQSATLCTYYSVAREGMTWEDWCNSDYNTVTYLGDDCKVYCSTSDDCIMVYAGASEMYLYNSNLARVRKTDKVVSDIYTTEWS